MNEDGSIAIVTGVCRVGAPGGPRRSGSLLGYLLATGAMLALTVSPILRAQTAPAYPGSPVSPASPVYPASSASPAYPASPGYPAGPAYPANPTGPGSFTSPGYSANPDYVPETPEQLEQLVAPIALYPDSLVAEILAASTFPAEVVEADRWLRAHRDLRGPALADRVDRQPWDDSVKALTAFPSVLGNMDQNLSWTSSLGEAYYNQPQDVMAAVQAMRARARAAGHLESTPEQAVTVDGADIVIEPVSPDFVYVPAYDPWIVYGTPVAPWPSWYDYPGIWLGGAYVSFAAGFSIGFVTGFEWGWHHWGCDWHGRYVSYDHGRYLSRGATLFHHRGVFGGVERGPGPRHGGFARPDHGAGPRFQGRQGGHVGAGDRIGPGRHVGPNDRIGPGHRVGPADLTGRGHRIGPEHHVGPGHRVGAGFPIGPRYRVRPGDRGGPGYRLHLPERSYRLGPRYRLGRSYRLSPRHPASVGYRLHAREAIVRPPPRAMAPHMAPRPAVRGPRVGGEVHTAPIRR